jgi:hypothetical protein
MEAFRVSLSASGRPDGDIECISVAVRRASRHEPCRNSSRKPWLIADSLDVASAVSVAVA